MKKIYYLGLCLISSLQFLKGQVTADPRLVGTDDTVTIYFNAQAGNAGLAGFTGNIYAHTGVITQNSAHPGDWKHVKAGWGSTDTSILMTPLGNDMYSIRFHIRSYYNIPVSDTVYQLAFVFRNANGSISGRSSSNGDIFYAINVAAPRNYLGFQMVGDEVHIYTDQGHFRAFTPDAGMLGLVYEPDSNQTYHSQIVVDSLRISLAVSDAPEYLRLSSGTMQAFLRKSDLLIGFKNDNDTILNNGFVYGGNGQLGISFDWRNGQVIHGTGSRAIDQNRFGRVLENYNRASFGYGAPNDQLNITIPAFVSNDGWGAYFDNYHRSWSDLGGSDPNRLEFRAKGGDLAFYVYGGQNADEVLNHFTRLTGRPYLPPRWAFGYIQSKYGYQNDAATRTMVNTMNSQNFPIDAVILDLYWFGSPTTMGNLNWDNSRFNPNLGLINWLHQQDIRLVLIYETYFTQNSTNYSALNQLGYFAKNQAGNTYVLNGFWAGSSGLLDLFHPNAWNWFWPFYNAKLQEGVDGFWNDLGEPEDHPLNMVHYGGKTAEEVHNLYSYEWAKGLYNSYQSNWPNKRIFNLIRSGFAGMQRLGAIPWSGDIQRSFNGLQAQIPNMLGMSMSGVPYMHSDLGGFTGGGQDNELYTKWMALGAFSPIMRAHGQEAVPTEPYAYPEPFKTQLRNIIKLRHKWFPYNYSIAEENTRTGRPMALPMDYFNPQQTNLINKNDQFLWGKDVVVAPYLQQGSTNRSIVLPSGEWIDYWTNARITGGGSINKSGSIDQIPLYLRAGSLIPLMNREITRLEKYRYNHIRWVHPYSNSGQARGVVYADDGLTPNSRLNNNFEEYVMTCRQGSQYSRYVLNKQGGTFTDAPDTIATEIQSIGFSSPVNFVKINGNNIPLVGNVSTYNAATTAAFYQSSNQTLRIKLNWLKSQTVIEVNNVPLDPLEDTVYACSLQGVTLNPGLGYLSYLWSNGAQSQNLNVSNPGQYWVRIEEAPGNYFYDTTQVVFLEACLPDSNNVCSGGSFSLQANDAMPYAYLWSNGQTSSNANFSASISGTVWVRISLGNVQCYDTTFIEVNTSSNAVNLGSDTTFQCLLDAGGTYASYLWSTGQTSRSINLSQPGYYWVQVTENISGCVSYDTIYAIPTCGNFFSGRNSGDKLGHSVDFDGHYGIAGAPMRDGSYIEGFDTISTNAFSEMGTAYIYAYDGYNWLEHQELVAHDRDEDDEFGTAVAISQYFAAVGAPKEKNDIQNQLPLNQAGSVYLYNKQGAIWTQVQKICPPDRQAGDMFGAFLKIHGDWLFIGSPGNSTDSAGNQIITGSGAVYVYKKDISNFYVFVQKITAPDRTAGDRFGEAFSVSTGKIIIGAPNQDTDFDQLNNMSNSGAAYVYKQNANGQYLFEQKLVALDRGSNDNFGHSLAIDDTDAFVGVPNEDHNLVGLSTRTNAGALYHFNWNGTEWVQIQKIVAHDRQSYDQFAYSLAINTERVLVGAPHEDYGSDGTFVGNSGSIYSYLRNPSNVLTYDQKFVPSDRVSQSGFGESIALNRNWLMVGAPKQRHSIQNESQAGWVGFYSAQLPVVSVLNTHTQKEITENSEAELSNPNAETIIFKGSLVYPNPSSGEVNVKTELNNYELILNDLNGRTILKMSQLHESSKFDLSEMPKGVYILTISDESGFRQFERLIHF